MTKENSESESDFPAKMSNPMRRALIEAGYSRLAQLTEVSEAELKKLHGVGPKGLDQLRLALEAKGLSFADKKKSKG